MSSKRGGAKKVEYPQRTGCSNTQMGWPAENKSLSPTVDGLVLLQDKTKGLKLPWA